MLVASAVIFGVVLVLVFVAVLRRRGQEQAPPTTSGGGLWIPAVGGIALPTVVIVALFALTLDASEDFTVAASAPASTIESSAASGSGTSRTRAPASATANEIHIPVGVPGGRRASRAPTSSTASGCRSSPEDRHDPRADEPTSARRADQAGVYRGQCAEFCGLQHAHMAFVVVAEPQAQFDAWLARRAAPAAAAGDARARARAAGSARLGVRVLPHDRGHERERRRSAPTSPTSRAALSLAAGDVPNSRGYLARLDPRPAAHQARQPDAGHRP